MLTRRSLLGFIAASPFIVKAASIMPVRSFAASGEWLRIMKGIGPDRGGVIVDDGLTSLALALNLDPSEFATYVEYRRVLS